MIQMMYHRKGHKKGAWGQQRNADIILKIRMGFEK